MTVTVARSSPRASIATAMRVPSGPANEVERPIAPVVRRLPMAPASIQRPTASRLQERAPDLSRWRGDRPGDAHLEAALGLMHRAQPTSPFVADGHGLRPPAADALFLADEPRDVRVRAIHPAPAVEQAEPVVPARSGAGRDGGLGHARVGDAGREGRWGWAGWPAPRPRRRVAGRRHSARRSWSSGFERRACAPCRSSSCAPRSDQRPEDPRSRAIDRGTRSDDPEAEPLCLHEPAA